MKVYVIARECGDGYTDIISVVENVELAKEMVNRCGGYPYSYKEFDMRTTSVEEYWFLIDFDENGKIWYAEFYSDDFVEPCFVSQCKILNDKCYLEESYKNLEFYIKAKDIILAQKIAFDMREKYLAERNN